MKVRCRSCHREETWADGAVQVDTPGGVRRPVEHASLAAWRTLRRCLEGEGVPVGRCSACDQPLVGPADAAWVPYELTGADGGVLSVGQGFTEVDATEDALVAAYGASWRDWRPLHALASTSLIVTVVTPLFLLWLGATISVILFLTAFGSTADLPGLKP